MREINPNLSKFGFIWYMQASDVTYINKRKLPPIPQIDYDADTASKETWPVQLFHNYKNQHRNIEIIGTMGSGKSTMVDQIIRLLGSKSKS